MICSRELIADQRAKRAIGEQAYIFDEVEYMIRKKRRVIVVWIDKTRFEYSSPDCLPDILLEQKLMVIEVNNYRKKERFQLSKRVTAEVAASIFQSNQGTFWNLYERERRRFIARIIFTIAIMTAIVWWLYREKNINLAYKLANDARVELSEGNRFEAKKLAAHAYELYPDVEGLSLLMQQCLDDGLPYRTFDSSVAVNEKNDIYAAIIDHRWVNIYGLQNDSLIVSFDGYNVTDVSLSVNGERVVGYSGDFLRVFDIKSKKPEPLMELSNDYEIFHDVDFNANGTLLLTQRNNCHSWTIYTIGNTTPLYRHIDYSKKDSLNWYEVRASFVGSDSTLIVYGKVSKNEPDYHHDCVAPKDAHWVCNQYNLSQCDKRQKDSPLLVRKIEVPENTQRIAVAKNFCKVIMAGLKDITCFWVDTIVSHSRYTTFKYRDKIRSWIGSGREKYEKEHFDTYNTNRIIDIHFSHDEEFAVLTDQSNVRFILSLGNYHIDQKTVSNGLDIAEDGKTKNLNNNAVGITNDGHCILIEPHHTLQKNLRIESDEWYANQHSASTFYKPMSDGVTFTNAIKTSNKQIFLTEKGNSGGEYMHDTQPFCKTYIYRKEQACMLEDVSQRLSLKKDSVLEVFSPSLHYAIIRIPKSQVKSEHLLWNFEKKCIEGKLEDFVSEKGYMTPSNSHFLSEDESIMLCDYKFYMQKDGEEFHKPGWALLDLNSKQTILTKGINGHEFHPTWQHTLLFTSKEDTTYFYDIVNKKLVLSMAGYHKIANPKRQEKAIVINTTRKIDEQRFSNSNEWIYLANENRLVAIPDSLQKRIMFGSPDGKWILAESNKWNAPWEVLNAKTFEKIYEIPNYERGNAIAFTPDSKYLLYQGKDKKELCRMDLANGKINSLLSYYNNIQSPSIYSAREFDSSPYSGMALSNRHIAFASHGIVIADIKTGKIVKRFNLPLSLRSRMMFSPSGKYLIVENYLIDVENLVSICNDLPNDPIRITDKGIIYRDKIYHFYSPQELYERIR